MLLLTRLLLPYQNYDLFFSGQNNSLKTIIDRTNNNKFSQKNTEIKKKLPASSEVTPWLLKDSFCSWINITEMLYISKVNTFFSLISKKCLFLKKMSVIGKGYKVKCSLVGVGYRVTSLKNNKLKLKIGRSYRVSYVLPKTVSVKVFGKRQNKLKFFSCDLQKLMVNIYLFRSLKWPDSYKGKGIKLSKQKVKIKFREKFGSIHYKSKK